MFANSFNPDQDQQNVGPDLDPNCLALWSVPERIFWKVNFEKSQPRTIKTWRITQNAKTHHLHFILLALVLTCITYINRLTLCMLGNFSCFYCRLLTYFKINIFKNFFQEHYHSVKQFGSRSERHSVRPDLCSNCSSTNLFIYQPLQP